MIWISTKKKLNHSPFSIRVKLACTWNEWRNIDDKIMADMTRIDAFEAISFVKQIPLVLQIAVNVAYVDVGWTV